MRARQGGVSVMADRTAVQALDRQGRRAAGGKFNALARIALGLLVLAIVLGSIALGQRLGRDAASTTSRAGQSETPPVTEPLIFAPIAADEARSINAAIPFARDRGPAARPFVLVGTPDSRERAIDCLAGAMWYEAGDDARGQQAVAQVVLNRVRHPAYPGSVCGVVFQGSERRTGCQFTFTCDGAMRRRPSPERFDLARERARAMLEGQVQAEVGLATHYHTDWVHPIWSAKLEKIARVDTHLFFRWTGVWGGPAAHRKRYLGGEPRATALALLSPAHRPAPVASPKSAADASPADALVAAATPPPDPGPVDLGGGRFRVVLSAARSGNVQAATALELCGEREYCKLTGVLDQQGAVVFVYLRDGVAERAMWDCEVFRRPTPAQCFSTVRDIPDVAEPAPGAAPSPSPGIQTYGARG